MPIPLISKIKPYNSGAFPVFEDVDGYGGYQVRATTADRDSIPALNRKIGMAVYVQADGYLYTLGTPGDNSNWLQSSDNNMFGDVTGSTSHSTVVGIQGRPVSPAGPLTGMALVWTGSSWAPEDLVGDVTGSLLANTVVNINGASVPVSGSLVTGNVLQVNGPSSLTYAPVNLGGGSNYVTGVLGSGNLPSLAGDVIGTIPANTVVKLRGNPVLSQSLGALQDGYALTWVNADGYWEAKPTNNGSTHYFPFLAGVFSTNTTSLFTIIGSAEFNLTLYPDVKTIRFQVLLETTGPIANAQLYNFTTTSLVTGTVLSTSNISTTLLTSGDISGNLTNGSAIYQAQIEMASGGASDFITCSMARFILQY